MPCDVHEGPGITQHCRLWPCCPAGEAVEAVVAVEVVEAGEVVAGPI